MTMQAPTPSESHLRILSSRRILPATPPSSDTVTTPLSIADATTARFSICGAIWFYEASSATPPDSTALLTRLEQSLSQTLDEYRHFAGQLRWSRPEDSRILPGPHTLGRPLIIYNVPTDPGVEFTHASHPRTLSSIVPTAKERMESKKVWLATDFKQDELLPSCPLAFYPDPKISEGLPGVSAQVTLFACGGWAIGVRMTHCLGDAVCLVAFVKAWAERARIVVAAGSGGREAITSQCLFDPALLDRHARVSADQPPDDRKVALARSLPMHRYDWWDTEAPGMPAWARSDALATRPDAQTLAGLGRLSPATPPPWATWDAGAAVDHVQIRITAAEVGRLKKAAQAGLSADGEFVSRLDALVAHLWVAINRARGLQDLREDKVYLNVSMGLRSRVSPPLPDTFAGSPLLLGHIGRMGADVCSSSLGSVALELRRMMAVFTPQAVGAYLHDAAHEVSPQRIWQAFLGSRQTGVTSWTKAGVYEVNFGAGRPQYVQARMPRLDGQLQIMDLGEYGDHEVSLCLEKETMKRLLRDERFWAWGADADA
ncbi:hypothetical protein N0V82_000036 [Gnomoniopsis sp. IMI 355080]|nr:hypothetical protein N0V82_000036 [Gnomoniopsis sp. IMI 355080]